MDTKGVREVIPNTESISWSEIVYVAGKGIRTNISSIWFRDNCSGVAGASIAWIL